MAFKARKIVKENRIRGIFYLDESQYKQLLIYKAGCEEEWNVKLEVKELVEEMINGLMDDDLEFKRFKKNNQDLVNKILIGDLDEESDEDSGSAKDKIASITESREKDYTSFDPSENNDEEETDRQIENRESDRIKQWASH